MTEAGELRAEVKGHFFFKHLPGYKNAPAGALYIKNAVRANRSAFLLSADGSFLSDQKPPALKYNDVKFHKTAAPAKAQEPQK